MAKRKVPTLDSIGRELRKQLQRARRLRRRAAQGEQREREEMRKLGFRLGDDA